MKLTFLSPVVEHGGAGRLVVGDVLRRFQGAVVLEVGGNAGGPEGVVADEGLDAGGFGAPLNHAVGVLLPQGLGGELSSAAGGGPEKRPVEVLGNASGGEVGVEIQLQVVMTGDYMLLAALLVQPDPDAAPLLLVLVRVSLSRWGYDMTGGSKVVIYVFRTGKTACQGCPPGPLGDEQWGELAGAIRGKSQVRTEWEQ